MLELLSFVAVSFLLPQDTDRKPLSSVAGQQCSEGRVQTTWSFIEILKKTSESGEQLGTATCTRTHDEVSGFVFSMSEIIST